MALLSKLSSICFTAVLAASLYPNMATPAVASMDPSQVTVEQLYGQIAGPSVEENPNFVFSPLSIFTVFHAAQRGAAGETRRQMDALVGPNESFDIPELEQSNRAGGAVVADVANRLYVHPGLEHNEHFVRFQRELEREKHSAEVIDFDDSAAAAKKINSFVADATRDHIKRLVDPSSLGPQTRLVLINALYFKAPWLTQFQDHATSRDVFFAHSGPQKVFFMNGTLTKDPLLISMQKEVLALGLPYADPRLRLYIFMPENLQEFEQQIVKSPKVIEDLIDNMESHAIAGLSEELHISMPRFKLSAEDNKIDLIELFASMGATDMFDMDKADFSGITGGRDLCVSSFVHQADIDVNEEGTEATAATAMAMMLRMMAMPKTPINVVLNKPFIFQLRFIDEGVNLNLFSGRIADPSTAQ
ncbi:serpin B6 [Cyclospora cayetanensis]|uniref:Serine protease n=2 Tax=Cyclospora cayetanensis TaxID=88456 RepID=A0A1D3CTY3_9EIME|nr:serpin B6 [Cyclospora cayetanensis]OEH74646.1 serine protease [Cyclospora cayetanensis]